MPFIPHTEDDIRAMLNTIGVEHIANLFSEIPHTIPDADLTKIAKGLNELEITRLMQARAPHAEPGSCFIGAGAYEHHIPAIVWEIASRGEFYTAYTPYQPEASQGTLQLIYEYQSCMAHLMGLTVSNASMYDGATALAEAVLMALRIKDKARRVLIPSTLNPVHRKVLDTFLTRQDVELIDLPYCPQKGVVDLTAFDQIDTTGIAAIIIPQPNFFGMVEPVDALVNKAKTLDALTIAYVNPLAMNLLKEPGSWGETGVDIACGEGQPLGVPLASGGPYFGFLCCRREFVRQMPGRIVGRSEDAQGRTGYVLTLQAREQHIRRSKATSNICTNQGLMVTAATIYMTLLGAEGLYRTALVSHQQATKLYQRLLKINGVSAVFAGTYFHEFVIRCSKKGVLSYMQSNGIEAGYEVGQYDASLDNCLLVCVTETKTDEDIERYANTLEAYLEGDDLSC